MEPVIWKFGKLRPEGDPVLVWSDFERKYVTLSMLCHYSMVVDCRTPILQGYRIVEIHFPASQSSAGCVGQVSQPVGSTVCLP